MVSSINVKCPEDTGHNKIQAIQNAMRQTMEHFYRAARSRVSKNSIRIDTHVRMRLQIYSSRHKYLYFAADDHLCEYVLNISVPMLRLPVFAIACDWIHHFLSRISWWQPFNKNESKKRKNWSWNQNVKPCICVAKRPPKKASEAAVVAMVRETFECF